MSAEILDMSPAAVLARAADVIARNGFAQDAFYLPRTGKDPRECPVCALGAIAVAAGFHPMAWEAALDIDLSGISAAANRLADFLALDDEESLLDSVGGWNDDAEENEVTAALRAAADAAKAAAPSLCACSEFGPCPAHGGPSVGDQRIVDGPNGGC